MAEPSTDGGAPRRPYNLFTFRGEPRMRLKLTDEGVVLEDDRLAWQSPEGELWASLSEIAEIHLQLGQVSRRNIGACSIRFKKGPRLTVTSASTWGTPDEERARAYRDFTKDLHGRLAALPRNGVIFRAGSTELRQKFAVASLILGVLMFIFLPVGLLIVTGEPKALFLTIAGVFFLFPAFRTLQKNTPRNYSPQHVPVELLP